MSLQSRLFSFFIAIVVLPLAVASILSQRIIVRELERRAHSQLILANRAAVAVYQAKQSVARDRVQVIVNDPRFLRFLVAGQQADLQDMLSQSLKNAEPKLDFVIVASPDHKVIASSVSSPTFIGGVVTPSTADIASDNQQSPSLLLVTRTVEKVRAGEPPADVAIVFGGYFLDAEFAKELSSTTGVDASVVIGGKVVASTIAAAAKASAPVPMKLAASQTFLRTTLAGGPVYAVPAPLSSGFPTTTAALLMSTSQRPTLSLRQTIRVSMVVLLGLAIVGSVLLGFLLARIIARPLRELAAGANAIAGGNYDQHIHVPSRDEVGLLAAAFNEMAGRLSIHISELRESREELKRALARFGETLRATHDERTLFNVVLETSIDTLRAESGSLMLMTPSRDALRISVARGVEAGEVQLGMGEGIAGYVAASGNPVRWPGGPSARSRSDREPEFRTALSVPIHTQDRVIAVLNVYDKEGEADFTESDLGTLLSLADQAGVAIENVLLHKEAQRLSITDGLTGVWNYRYFQMQYEQEIDRSSRFRRPFSLIVCDIDNFKKFNDTYGHQVGDAVLIELARRVKSVIRDIDVLARYGGEEFVLILPETDIEGGLRTAEKLRTKVSETPFGDAPPIKVTVSAGVACFPNHGGDGPGLLRAADVAMFTAKKRGKDQTHVYQPGDAVGEMNAGAGAGSEIR